MTHYPPRSVLGAAIDNNNLLSSCRHQKTITSDYSLNLNDYIIMSDSTSGLLTITLLPPDKTKTRIFEFSKIDSSANAVRLFGNIEGDPYFDILIQWENIPLVSNGTYYKVL